MTVISLKAELNHYEWHRWLERPFCAFVFSLFANGSTREAFAKIGIEAEHGTWAFQDGAWYESAAAIKPFVQDLRAARENGLSMFAVTKCCEEFYAQARQRVQELLDEEKDPLEKLTEVQAFLRTGTTFIWLAHGFEDILSPLLVEEVKKMGITDTDNFIAEITFPKKHNAHARFETALLSGEDIIKVQKEFGWMAARGGFAPGFTVQDLENLRVEISNKPEPVRAEVIIPESICALAEEAQELVYYRTLRTDLFYDLFYLARPILVAVAEKFGVDFADLKYCSVADLMHGKYKPYPANVNAYTVGNEFALTTEQLIVEKKSTENIVKGRVAYPGIAQGKVVLVKSLADCAKVQEGNILVTTMTFPSYIMAMKKAAAFVTDEGGITCHAAIIARERQKPCVIGTKNATRILRDGDMVEVNADNGTINTLEN